MRERTVEEEDYCILHTNSWSVRELEGIQLTAHQAAKVVQHNPLQGLHQMWCQSHWPEVVGLPGVRCLGDRDNTGSLPQDWDSPQTQADVSNVPKETPQSSSAPSLSSLGANPVRTRSLPHLHPPKHISHLICSYG